MKGIGVLISLALIGVTARILGRRGFRAEGLRLDLELSAVILLTLMLSPISWTHHYLLAVIPIWTIVAAASRWAPRGVGLAIAVGLAFLLIARKPHWELFAEGIGRLALSAALSGALILWGSCLHLLRRVEDPDRRTRELEVPRAA